MQKAIPIEIPDDNYIKSYSLSLSSFNVTFQNKIYLPILKNDIVTIYKRDKILFSGYVDSIGEYGFSLTSFWRCLHESLQ